MSVAVLGAGAFGTALAISLGRKSPVTLWARSPDVAADMQSQRENRLRLPGQALNDAVTVTNSLDTAMDADMLLLAVPMQKLRAFARSLPPVSQPMIACCKGFEVGTGLGPVSVLKQVNPNTQSAILTGPSFADDIAQGLPTALTLACTDDSVARALQVALTTPNLRIYRTIDVIGAELGGALKNVIAIACGAAIGAGLGESARAALMTRGFAEMRRIAALKGADAQTLTGLSGFGDLALTCASVQSRNFRLGLALGRAQDFDSTVTVEGAATAVAVLDSARDMDLDMPITEAVVSLIDQKQNVGQAMADLLSRPLRVE